MYIYFVIGLKTCLVHRNDCYLNEIVSLIYIYIYIYNMHMYTVITILFL